MIHVLKNQILKFKENIESIFYSKKKRTIIVVKILRQISFDYCLKYFLVMMTLHKMISLYFI